MLNLLFKQYVLILDWTCLVTLQIVLFLFWYMYFCSLGKPDNQIIIVFVKKPKLYIYKERERERERETMIYTDQIKIFNI